MTKNEEKKEKTVNCIDINGKLHKADLKKLNFRPGVYGLLIEEGKILLSPQRDGYDFPGGGIEKDENIEEALKREFFEETGLKISIENLITCEQSFFTPIFNKASENKEKKYWNGILIFYLVKKVSGEISTKHLEDYEKEFIKKAEWIDLDKIEELKFINTVNSPEIIQKGVKLALTKGDSYENLYKRALADYQNLIKQSAIDKQEFVKYANENLILEILPVFDNLKMSIASLNDEEKNNPWVEGIKYVIKQFNDVFKNIGIKEIITKNQKFNPEEMEAVEGKGEKVKKQVRPGYKLQEKVIIPARVILE